MKNRQIQKSVAFLLALFMIFGSLSVQCFAANIFAPKIVKVEFADESPLSMKEITRIFRLSGEKDTVLLREDNPFENIVFCTGFDYHNIKFTLSDGRQSTLRDVLDEYDDINSFSHAKITVSYNDCITALKNGTTVDVKVSFSIGFRDFGDVRYEGIVQKEIVEEVLTDFRNTSNEPVTIYEGVELGDCIEGQEFELRFADGTVKTAKVEHQAANMWWDERLLDNRVLRYSHITEYEYDEFDNEVKKNFVTYLYMDEYYQQEAVVVPCPYEKIEINDYVFSEGNTLSSITYTLTSKDGTTQTYTKEPDCNISAGYPVIDKLGPYEIKVSVDADEASFAERASAEIWIYVGDYILSDVVNTETTCDCICHQNGISFIIYQIISKIWEIFQINEFCKCGAWHW